MSIRRTIGISILLLLAAVSHASIIECVGTATQVVNGNDTLFIFKDEIHLRSTIGNVTWCKGDGTVYASGVTDIYPDDGVFLVNGHRFIATRYQDSDSVSFRADISCTGTTLHVMGDSAYNTRTHTYSLSYNTLAWNTEEWVDSIVIDSAKNTNTIPLHWPLYDSTTIFICIDSEIREALSLPPACVDLFIPIDSIKAVKMQLMSLATTRGKEGEKSNERNRPTSQELIASSEYSGPLEVAFYSNPTPAAQFYKWSIYHSTELIVTRNDKDIRYTFSEPGSYRVVCAVNNATCTSDSMEVTVAVAESYLAVPNVFTPNGDGKNDEFRVAYRSLRDFHIWVYNRWGKLVYESTDPAKGWDGNINGRPAAEGAYFYVVRAMGTDAAKNASFMMKASYNKKKLNADESVLGIYQMSGDINLLRGK